MSAIKILAPGERLMDELVASILRFSGGRTTRDLSRNVVVFPGKRPAHVFRKTLAERIGASFLPPTIFSIDLFIEHCYTKILKCTGQKLTQLDAVAIMLDVHRTLVRRVGKDAYRSLESFYPVGLKLVGELEEVLMANLTPRRIREVLGGIEVRTVDSLADYYEHFYQRVEARGGVTRAMMYRTVAERVREIPWSDEQSITLAGFYAFTNVERMIVSHLKEVENVTLLFQHGVGLKRQLVSIGVGEEHETTERANVAQEPDEEVTNAPDIEFIRAPDLHGQVAALAALFEQQTKSGNNLDRRTAVVLPSSEALFPVVHGALSMLPEDSYNVALQYPLSRTPLFGFLHSLMKCAASQQNGVYSNVDYLKFVLHPYTKNIRFDQRAEATRIFFHAVEDYFLERPGTAFFRLEELENADRLFSSVAERLSASSNREGESNPVTAEQLRSFLIDIHQKTLRGLEEIGTVGALADRMLDVAEFIISRSTARLHPLFQPYVQRVVESLNELKNSFLAGESFADRSTAFLFLRQYLARETVPFPGTPLRGLQVLGLLETRSLDFDTLYILDATDDVLPGNPSQNMLLPQGLRIKLGLETSYDAERLIEYYLDVAMQNARRVVFLYSESGEREKSRYVQKLLWRRQQERGTFKTDEFEQRVLYRVRLETERPEPVEKTPALIDALRNSGSFSANALDTYLACQLKFYYQYVLRLDERGDVQERVEASDVGVIVHRILAEFFEPAVGRQLVVEDLDAGRLEGVIASCFKETFGSELTGTALLLKRQVSNQLRRFLAEYQQSILKQESVELESVERWLEVEHRGFRFKGRIDRIERRGNNVYIIDYKTGANDGKLALRLEKLDVDDPGTWAKAIPTFQLSIYMLLYSRATGAALSTLVPRYLFLGGQRMDETIEGSIGGDEHTPAEVHRHIERVIMKAIESILDQNQPFTPTPDLEQHCPRCPFTAICGTQWVQGWAGK